MQSVCLMDAQKELNLHFKIFHTWQLPYPAVRRYTTKTYLFAALT